MPRALQRTLTTHLTLLVHEWAFDRLITTLVLREDAAPFSRPDHPKGAS
jgi:hypothetical protein